MRCIQFKNTLFSAVVHGRILSRVFHKHIEYESNESFCMRWEIIVPQSEKYLNYDCAWGGTLFKMTVMKKEIKIFIVGGRRGISKLMLESLKLRYSDVSYFRNSGDCQKVLDQNPDILILKDTLKIDKQFDFLKSVKRDTKAHVIYLSRDTHFMHVKKILKKGALDIIVNDSYANYAVNKSIERILELTDNLKNNITTKECFYSSSIKSRFPYRFGLLQMIL